MSGLGDLRPRRERDEGIDIAPLIDVVFILLIFFMVSTTFVRDQQLEIERPSAASATPSDVRAVRVMLSRGGRVLVEGDEVNPWMVRDRIRTLILRNPNRPVLVTADREAPTGRLVDVVDQCRLAGAADVGVDVEAER